MRAFKRGPSLPEGCDSFHLLYYATTMRNAILKDKADKARQRFIDSIDSEAICRLASSYHVGLPCKPFGSPKHGSFNVCVFVEFDTSPPERWAVRIPLPARAVWIDEKIEIELATMK